MMETSLSSAHSSSYILTLPVELLHRILDYLDTRSILFSFRPVCKTFYSVTNNYNGLTLNLSDDSSKTPFDHLYRIIPMENVGRLILEKFYQNNQLNDIDRFTRLRSVNLVSVYYSIDEFTRTKQIFFSQWFLHIAKPTTRSFGCKFSNY